MQWWQALILGIVQGLTEFWPISSTAHLRIVPYWLGWADPGAAFTAVIQLGTLLAVFLYFWKDVLGLIQGTWESLQARRWDVSENSRMAWAIGAGTIPIVVFGLGFKGFIENEARGMQIIGTTLIVLGVLLYLSERFSKQTKTIRDLTFKDIQIIGLCQALALIPGCSRSGSTIMGGMWLNMTRESAARFSFLLGLPAILSSGLFQLLEILRHGVAENDLLNLLIATVASFVVGYASIGFLLHILKRYGSLIFVVYRVLLGVAILAFWS